MAYEFHYTPTGTGVISGKEVLEQTEDAINDLGNTAISGVQEALDKAEQALTNSENAVDDAQTALNTANNAEGVAIQAQTDVGNLSGTVTNIGNRVTTAEGNITNLQGRMTTAEGNVTNLQGRMTTAEGNIGNLQTAVSTAQATANSAQQTATTARQQSYVFRYSSTALTASSTNSNSLLDNTNNLKVGDKVIDSSGVLFSITAIDTQNSTFTIGTALIDLAQDSDVMHLSGDETCTGNKGFVDNIIVKKIVSNVSQLQINARSNADSVAVIAGADASQGGGIWLYGKNSSNNSHVAIQVYDTANSAYHAVRLNVDGSLTPTVSNNGLGSRSFKWVSFNGLNPSALGMPDLDNGIDISSYITVVANANKESLYTPTVNGWISVALTRASGNMAVMLKQGNITSSGHRIDQENGTATCNAILPVKGGVQVSINSALADGIYFAYFYPCLGNV